jgi:hypothetical protein
MMPTRAMRVASTPKTIVASVFVSSDLWVSRIVIDDVGDISESVPNDQVITCPSSGRRKKGMDLTKRRKIALCRVKTDGTPSFNDEKAQEYGTKLMRMRS